MDNNTQGFASEKHQWLINALSRVSWSAACIQACIAAPSRATQPPVALSLPAVTEDTQQ
jgi:hypothetical protein